MFAAATPPRSTANHHSRWARVPGGSFATQHTISVRHYSVLFFIFFSSFWTPKFQRIVVFLRFLEAKKGASG